MRSDTIEVMKGIGIILVVLYHSMVRNIPTITVNWDNGLFNIIASFFMMMFMMISGYLVYGKVGNFKWTLSKLIKFLIPTLVFMILYWIFSDKDIVLPFGRYLLLNISYGFQSSPLWYIWCLMLCYIIAHLVENARLKIKLPFEYQFGLLLMVILALPVYSFGFNFVKWYGIFFFIGYMFKHSIEMDKGKIFKFMKLASYSSLILFPLSIYLTNWMIPYQDMKYGYNGYTIIANSIQGGRTDLVLVMFGMAILGTLFINSIARLIKGKLAKPLIYLGRVSLPIYLIHIFFVGIVHNYILATLISISIPIILYEFLKRYKWCNFILFGGTDIPITLSDKLGGWYAKAQE